MLHNLEGFSETGQGSLQVGRAALLIIVICNNLRRLRLHLRELPLDYEVLSDGQALTSTSVTCNILLRTGIK